MSEIRKTRESNIELCRIISMLMIICHHAVVHGGALGMNPCVNKWIAYFFAPGGKICFDTFIAISCWFLVDQEYKTKRFLKMWLEVLFFNVLTTIAAAVLGSSFTPIEWISVFLPITGGAQGYAQTYLAFYLVLPFLSKVSQGITRKQNMMLILIMSIFVFLFRMVADLVWSEQSVYCRLLLFIFIYFIMMYTKKNPIKILNSPVSMLIMFISGWMFIFLYCYLFVSYPECFIWKFTSILVVDEGGIVYLIAGLSLFFFFKNIKIRQMKWINILVSTTLAVLLIHDGHFFRGWTWNLLKANDWYYSEYFLLWIILSAVLIYIVCTMVDIARKYLIEQQLFKSKAICKICDYFDNILLDRNEPEN